MPTGTALALGGAGIVSGILGAGAARSAANTQTEGALEAARIQAAASNRAADMQLGMFNTIRDDLSPYRSVGSAALPSYLGLLGIQAPTASAAPASAAGVPAAYTGTPGVLGAQSPGTMDWNAYLTAYPDVMAEYSRLSPNNLRNNYGITTPQQFAEWHYNTQGMREGRAVPTYGGLPGGGAATAPAMQAQGSPTSVYDPTAMQRALEATPGYQFTRDQGMKAVTSSLFSKGLGGASGAYGKGLARFVTGLADQTYGQNVERMAHAVGIGQSAANQTGAYGQSAATGAGNALIGGANASAGGIAGAANAGAAGTIGAANAIGSGINNAASGLLAGRVLGMYAPQANLSQVASSTIANNPLLFG